MSKLTGKQVAQIRALRSQGLLQREVGARFGISQVMVSRIWRNLNWRTESPL